MTTLTSNEKQSNKTKRRHLFRKKVNESIRLSETFHTANSDHCTDTEHHHLSIDDDINIMPKRSSSFSKTTITLTPIESEDETDNETQMILSTNSECQRQSISRLKNAYHQKQHIMISYDISSIRVCHKIYHRLVEKHYKVWIDLEHMFDNHLHVDMTQVIENSYIILLCMNQEYFESDYCRLEAEYATESRIKFIPCLMEPAFHPKSWLGLIISLFKYYSHHALF